MMDSIKIFEREETNEVCGDTLFSVSKDNLKITSIINIKEGDYSFLEDQIIGEYDGYKIIESFSNLIFININICRYFTILDLIESASKIYDVEFLFKIKNYLLDILDTVGRSTSILDFFDFFIDYSIRIKIKSEFYWQDKFKRLYPLISDCKIVDHKDNPHHRPDVWVEKNNELVPVECKLRKFNKSALVQLLRYINFYNCKHGIACAEELTIDLPDNISFVSFQELENVENSSTPNGITNEKLYSVISRRFSETEMDVFYSWFMKNKPQYNVEGVIA